MVHLLVERHRLLERRDAELLAQRANAAAVLLERASAVAGPRVEADQLAMGGLVDRIHLEPARWRAESRPRTRRARRAPPPGAAAPSPARGAGPRPRASASARSPRCHAGRNPREVAREERRRLAQAAPARRRVAASARNRATSSSRPGPRRSAIAVAGGIDPLLADRLAQGRERAPQRAARPLEIVLGHRSSQSPSRDRGRSASARCASSAIALRVSKADRLAVPGHARRAEQGDLDGHSATITAKSRRFVTNAGRPQGRLLAMARLKANERIMGYAMTDAGVGELT